MNILHRSLTRLVPALLLAGLLSSCTKDKAEAVKTGAARLRDTAQGALQRVREILVQNISMPFDDDHMVEQLAAELATERIDTKILTHVLGRRPASPALVAKIDGQLATMQGHYVQFAKMFERLPQGSFLAKDAVKRAEKHAANLTVQMINLAQQIEGGTIEVRNNPKRILLEEEITALQSLPESDSKTEALKRVARRVIELRKEEDELKQNAIRQCLAAAEAGSVVTDLIRNYKNLNVDQMLAVINQSLGFVAEITNGNAQVGRWLEQYQEIEKSFRSDPYWSKLLDNQITPTAVGATPVITTPVTGTSAIATPVSPVPLNPTNTTTPNP